MESSTLNSSQPFSFTRPLINGSFDAQRAVEHEIDEVMGLGSFLNRSHTTCPSLKRSRINNTWREARRLYRAAACSGGVEVGYVGNNSGTLQFNSVTANVTGSNVMTIWYTNGDAVRYALSERERQSRNACEFPVHWLVSNCRLNTEDGHFERWQQQHA